MSSTVRCCLLACSKALLACPLSHRQLLWPRYRYNLIIHSLMLWLLLDWWGFFGYCQAVGFYRQFQEKQSWLQPCMCSQTFLRQAGQRAKTKRGIHLTTPAGLLRHPHVFIVLPLLLIVALACLVIKCHTCKWSALTREMGIAGFLLLCFKDWPGYSAANCLIL